VIKTVATINEIETRPTRTGGTMGLIKTSDKTFTTFEDKFIRKAQELDGQPVLIGYEEKRNGQYTNFNIKELSAADGAEPINLDSGPGVQQHGAGSHQASTPPSGDGWKQESVIRAAQSGEWRAASDLLRREDIQKSVALKEAINFLTNNMPEKDRTPGNIRALYDHFLGILSS